MDWKIDHAGILHTNTKDGRPIATLEPELRQDWLNALRLVPRLVSLGHLLVDYRAAEERADAIVGVRDHRQAVADLGEASRALWRALDQIREGLSHSPKAPLLPSPVSELRTTCSCEGACGEAHAGTICNVRSGQSIRRQRGLPGVWRELVSDPKTFHPRVEASVRITRDGPRCQRCAWLTARRRVAALHNEVE